MKHFYLITGILFSLPATILGQQAGPYHLQLKADQIIHEVRINVNEDKTVDVVNGSEIIKLQGNLSASHIDTLEFPVFNSFLIFKKKTNSILLVEWLNKHKEYTLTGIAYPIVNLSKDKLNGFIYSAQFGNTPDQYTGIVTMRYNNNYCEGTIQTETGDYRYLEGRVNNDLFKLSAFDGSHLFSFHIKKTANGYNGTFYSGKSYSENFTIDTTNQQSLKDPYSISKIISQPQFTFPDDTGKLDSLSNEKYRNKVIIIQLLGSWCPNCMDETKFLTDLYKEYAESDLAIIGLAFEAKDDFNYASNRIKKLKRDLNVPYPILLAGTSNKKLASTKVPWLNEITSFPTTVILDHNHNPVSVYTGFNGPGTGDPYLKYVTDTKNLIQSLIDKKKRP